MICLSCKRDLQVQNAVGNKALFCPGCGWTGSYLEIIDDLQRQLNNIKQELNDEKNINDDSNSND